MIKLEAETLPKLLKAKDHAGVKAHFQSIVRQLNDKGWTQEVTIITSFTTMADEFFAGDPAGYLAYLTAYRQKYRGRAFVEEVDLALVIKSAFQTRPTVALAGIKDEIKELKSQQAKSSSGGASSGEVNNLKSRVEKLENRVSKLERDAGNSSGGGGGGKTNDRKPGSCGICGEFGHFARNCPNAEKETKKGNKKDDESKDDEE